MRKSRFNEAQILGIRKQAEGGAKVDELAREHGVSTQRIYNRRAKCGGLDVSEAKRLRELKEENRRLKKLVAHLSLDRDILKDALGKKWRALHQRARWAHTSESASC